MSLDQYSQTPASNDLANYFQTGMRPSAVKIAGWDIMADLAMQIGAGSLPTTGGTANAQTITNTRQVGALYAGLRFRVLPSATNTGAMTFAPDGLAAKNVFANGVAAIAGMWVQNVPADIIYDGTQWNLLNPQRSTGSFTGTGTGFASTAPTCTITYRATADFSLCTLVFGTGMTGTSNATTFTITGMPASLTPVQTQAYYITPEDNTAATTGSIIFTAASATITLAKSTSVGAGLSSWTSAGTKAFANSGISGNGSAIIFCLN